MVHASSTSRLRIALLGMLLGGMFGIPSPGSVLLAADGELEFTIVDSQSHQPLPVRMELNNARGKSVRARGLGVGRLGGHFYLSGEILLPLRRGGYRFTLDAGPEYRTQQGHFEIERRAEDAKQVEMRRFANLAEEGWWAGDVDSQREGNVLPLVAAAEGMAYAPTTAWRLVEGKWLKTDALARRPTKETDPVALDRALGPLAVATESPGGDLLLVAETRLDSPPEGLASANNLQVLVAARNAGLRTVALTPTAWELPLWIASGKLDAVVMLTRQSEWKKVDDDDPNGRPRARSFYPGKQGLTRWGEAIYFHWLNAGVKLTAIAGSGSGANNSPLGTNRAYVHLEGKMSANAWWQGVREGAVVVTNGPLLRPLVGGDPPGTTFQMDSGESIDFRMALNLASRQRVEYLELLKNGEVAAEVRLSDWAKSGGKLPPVTFQESGWFAVRAVTENRGKYQLALSAPFYVESPAGVRISRTSVEFFLTWLDELEKRLGQYGSFSESDLAMGRAYWTSKLEQANAP